MPVYYFVIITSKRLKLIWGGNQRPYLIITYSEIVNIEITGIDDGGLYNTNVIPEFNMGTATLNGTSFTSGTPVTAEGSYTLTVTAGTLSKTIQFRIDKTSPTGSVTINGGAVYTTSREIILDFTLGAGVTDAFAYSSQTTISHGQVKKHISAAGAIQCQQMMVERQYM
ncbi:hypothetical protein OL548_33795 (plasmid) [Lysinibacillus sp. MHQ-1]|nr:hypothetical protein OL548_33795 [Lysinibacillus sp. MHQ-1]